jgi:molybdopterin biosynthesis enzyme
MVVDSDIQRIVRLTPLADVLNTFQTSVEPVPHREERLTTALGCTLAADVAIAERTPAVALALRDGFAVRSETTLDASSYAPVPLMPMPARVNLGEALPENADAVAALDAVNVGDGRAEILTPVAPGEGVLPAGADAEPGVLRLAGARLRRIDVALMASLGIERVTIRVPRLRVVDTAGTEITQAAARLIAGAIQSEGGVAHSERGSLDAALDQDSVDALVAIGGTGSGRNDASVRTLARLGRVAFHGIGIMPGETTGVGFVGPRPVLLLPGRLDAALAGWLTVGRRLLAQLCFRLTEDQPFLAELSRKVASPLGLAEVVPVRRRLSTVEPLASGYLSPQALARSDGWILVPADSEGYPAGTKVPVRPWP